MLQIAIDAADQADVQKRMLVLGAHHKEIQNSIDLKSVDLTVNPAWEEGMSATLKVALNQVLEKDPDTDQILVMLCDQPFVDSELLDSMIAAQAAEGKGIVACYYQETFGVPVLFDRKYFEEIMALSGQDGAKQLIYKHPDDTTAIDFPEGKIDIDTKEDYENLKGK